MSNRRRTRAARDLAARLAWWRETGHRLGCETCAGGPACDECGHSLADTVATFGNLAAIATLEHSHFHVCTQCRDRIHAVYGLERVELGDL